ncbi:MAG: ABC transporter ATP-binding protein [Dinoroseobacter sp.]|nr:ABC transporter ATP-binding protein [Dinoroseobacter sp.]
MNVVLAVRDLTCVAPNGTTLLQNASFELERGAILAIAGPNGAGKTTLLNGLCGINDPTSGDILISGRNLCEISAADRARLIAVVGQQDTPDGRLSLREYVTLGQIPIQSDRSATEHADALERTLALTGLTTLAGKKMSVLSGGERQRAHIARALAQNPSLLFLDEPTNHLDPDAKGRMLSLVTGLGITVIMVLHDLVLIPEFATHAALLKDGRLISFGPADEVLTPDRVRDTFGVPFLQFQHEDRVVAALDIRNTSDPTDTRSLF